MSEGWLAGGVLGAVVAAGAALSPPCFAAPPGSSAATGVHTRRRPSSAQNLPSPRVYEHWLRAELARTREEPDQAREQVLLALVYDERARPLQRALAELEVEVGTSRSSRRALRRLARFDPGAARLLRARWEAAHQRLTQGLNEARRAFEARARWQPEGETWLALAVEAGQPRAAALRLAMVAPHRSEPHRVLAELDSVAEAGPRRLRRARVHRERALAAAPDGPDGEALVRLDHRLGEDALAAARARAWLERAPSRSSRRALAVRAALWADDLASALELAEPALALGAAAEVSAALADEGVWARAPALRRRGLRPLARRLSAVVPAAPRPRPKPTELSSALKELEAHLKLGRAGLSDRERLERLRAGDPDDPHVVGLSGILAHLDGDAEHARKRLGRAARLNPDAWLEWSRRVGRGAPK